MVIKYHAHCNPIQCLWLSNTIFMVIQYHINGDSMPCCWLIFLCRWLVISDGVAAAVCVQPSPSVVHTHRVHPSCSLRLSFFTTSGWHHQSGIHPSIHKYPSITNTCTSVSLKSTILTFVIFTKLGSSNGVHISSTQKILHIVTGDSPFTRVCGNRREKIYIPVP